MKSGLVESTDEFVNCLDYKPPQKSVNTEHKVLSLNIIAPAVVKKLNIFSLL